MTVVRILLLNGEDPKTLLNMISIRVLYQKVQKRKGKKAWQSNINRETQRREIRQVVTGMKRFFNKI